MLVPDRWPIAGAVVARPFAVLFQHVFDTAVLLVWRAPEGGAVPAHLEKAAVPAGQVTLRLRVLDQVVEFHDSAARLLMHDRLVDSERDNSDLPAERLAGFPDFELLCHGLAAESE